jgi:integrase
MVEACRPYFSRQIAAMVDLQMLTGARCGELVIMRPIDLETDRGDGVWVYRPAVHKTEHLGKQREIFVGPRAQQVLAPFLTNRRVDQFMFSPAEAEEERRAVLTASRTTPMSCGNTVGSNRKQRPERRPGDCYTTESYYVAVRRTCDQAFPPPPHLRPQTGESKKAFNQRMTAAMREELRRWQKDHRWFPYRLRHSAATQIRRAAGLEAAQLALGHASAAITDSVYAERDSTKVAEVMRRIG